MGLSGPKKRRKISHDPNNTHWSRSETNYGHRMLISQGWTPGTHLGATNASHAGLHSAASLSYIRVTLKEDTLGLGAKRGGGPIGAIEGDSTGLDVFQSLLGRLNGKDDGRLVKEQTARDDFRRDQYVHRRWGEMRFVRGGFLVGNKIEEEMQSDKRTLASTDDTCLQNAAPLAVDESRSEKAKKKKRKCQDRTDDGPEEQLEKTKDVQSRPKKSKRKDDRSRVSPQPPEEQTSTTAQTMMYPNEDDKRTIIIENREASKKSKKTNKTKKEKKKKKKKSKDEEHDHPSTPPLPPTVSSIPVPVPDTTPPPDQTRIRERGRTLLRQRYIHQKRLAVMDARALNEILMIKS